MPGQFKCQKCDRSFTMAAHLGRHVNAVHGAGRKGKSKKSSSAPGRGGRSGGSMHAVEGPTKILADISEYRDVLIDRRSTIDEQIQSLENAMGMMSGGLAIPDGPSRKGRGKGGRPRGVAKTGKGKGSRAGREGSLKQFIVKVLGGTSKPLTPSEIAAGVVKVGYKTTASNLTKAVSNALPQMNQVKKAGRGLYRV
ncbi:MAG: C2H2-type zinc finger protein [Planctomycetes bacterium]|nr:C2H2-type zinc finger protein [Planctomycetota bacterium]MBI3834336.1 C2H2-type zinc finger protein [Planctomycetota bacterium]